MAVACNAAAKSSKTGGLNEQLNMTGPHGGTPAAAYGFGFDRHQPLTGRQIPDLPGNGAGAVRAENGCAH